MISIKKRVQPVQRREIISNSDVKLLLMLPVYAVAAWGLPERVWPNISWKIFPGRRGRSSNSISDSIVSSELLPSGHIPAPQVSDQLEKNRITSYLQYLKDYRPGGWKMSFRIEGADEIAKAQLEGKGVVLWVAHFVFNGLPLKKALCESGYEVSHLSRPEHGFSSTRFGVKFLNPIRSRIEDRYLKKRIMITRGAEQIALREAHRQLQKGGIVSITAGHWEGRKVAQMPIGKVYLPVSTGAPGLAFATQSVLLPVFIAQQKNGSFLVTIGRKVDFSKCEDRESASATGMVEMSHQLIPHIIEFPGQWRGWKYLKRSGNPEPQGNVDSQG